MSLVEKFESCCDRIGNLARTPLYFSLLVIGTLLGIITREVGADPDLFHRLAMGRLLSGGAPFPYSDPFSFTPKLPLWIDHEWLSGVVFFELQQFGGDGAILFLRAATFVATTLILIRILFLLVSPSPAVAAWFLVCLLHGAFGWGSAVRCQVFTYLFIPFMILGVFLAHLRDRWTVLYLTPVIMIPWCNLHGGFVLGLIILLGLTGFLIVTKGRWLRAACLTALSLAATSINPYGFSTYWGYLIRALTMRRAAVLEWEPLWQQLDQFGITVCLSLVSILGVILYLRGRGTSENSKQLAPSMQTLLLIGGLLAFSGYCAFRHSRFLVFYMVLLAPLGAPLWNQVVGRCVSVLPHFSSKIRRVWSLMLPVGAVGSILLLVQGMSNTRLMALDYSKYPEDAVDQLLTLKDGGTLLLSFNVGGYALWRLHPKFLVSMDGRYETVYLDETVELNEAAIATGDLEKVKGINPTDILLMKDDNSPAVVANLSSKWIVWYEDSLALLLRPIQLP
jgi:hypothetical protein